MRCLAHALPVVPGENDDYDYAMTAVPGEALRLLYEKFGARASWRPTSDRS